MVVTSHLNDVFLAPAVCSQGMRAEMVRREGQHHLRDLPSGLSRELIAQSFPNFVLDENLIRVKFMKFI